jgi:hypothetical protein
VGEFKKLYAASLSTGVSLFLTMPWYKFVLQNARLNKAVKTTGGELPFVLVIPELFRSVPILKVEKYSLKMPVLSEF